ncbi:MAG: DNA/RNA nuclease SfsA [Rhodocyclaceae bacterium]|nr:DNA/RNA nuclease SfsA [Rhodocyclaceae bacterium]
MLLPSLTEGVLIRRRNRFVAEVEVGGAMVEAHCPNTGSMMGCRAPGSRVWISRADNPARKLAWTWELVEADGTLVGLHTGRSNGLVREAIEGGVIAPLSGYGTIRNEVRYGENSRIDLLLEGAGRPPCWVEVKNVTAAVTGGIGYFPDAVTERGAKHLREMMRLVAAGQRAVLCFCVQRGDVTEVRPADHIDPAYGQTLRTALAACVEVIAWGAAVTPQEILLRRPLAVLAA